jgi:hypothetical protein
VAIFTDLSPGLVSDKKYQIVCVVESKFETRSLHEASLNECCELAFFVKSTSLCYFIAFQTIRAVMCH